VDTEAWLTILGVAAIAALGGRWARIWDNAPREARKPMIRLFWWMVAAFATLLYVEWLFGFDERNV
jgi:type VI protein secretion system component VasF